ncbi:hypothetical protein FE257_013030 [Aspergillus nanangensis]|uniref:Alpha/beta hydrolase fold-3 domain-containing protein n=1 Tax=Aspergillus nanangensis TaxID=2582783 RepID=A0AAD4GRD5_ASPNN|nr:hypothetical protein FE257_013030 [Aspergillus nanangensis]
MNRREYVYKEAGEGQSLVTNVWHQPGGSPIYFHGGNWVLGHKDMLSRHYIQELLALGFGAVVSPNYRLGPTISAQEGPIQNAKDSYLWAQTILPTLLVQDANVHLDGSKIVTLGHSAGGTLALLMASLPQKPLAILDIFGPKYFNDEFYHTPNPAFSKIPNFEQSLIDRIQDDVPPPSTTPPPAGPNGPDFSNYRVAWLFTSFKKGTWLRSVVPDGGFSSVDPAGLFSSSSPPTSFIHGSADGLVDVRFSRQAFSALEREGVDSKLVIADAGHRFDAGAKPGDHQYNLVVEGVRFLASYAITPTE